MGSLNQPANASMVYIIIAGIIMVITLLTSKKAKIVLQTSLDLSKQNTGDESFGTSYAARAVVRFFNNLANSVVSIVPQKVKAWINSRFNQKEIIIEDNAAFDLIRGLVSIVLASMLIAVGTSLKMPLSTTYVVFMVSMGASFADRAWSRESAVFRVTGVFSVIGGWLITAVVAFFLAFVFALFLNFTGIIGTIISIALALYIILIDSRKAAQEDDDTDKAFDEAMRTNDKAVIMSCILDHNRESLMSLINDSKTMYNQITQAFVDEDIKVLRNMTSQCKIEKNSMKMLKRKEIQMMRRLDESEIFRKNTWFHLNYNCIEQILYSLRRICEPCKEYVDNSFSPLGKEYVEELNKVKEMTNWAIDAANIVIYSSDYKEHEIVMDRIKRREDELMNISIEQMNRIQKKHENIDLSVLYLNIIQESVEIVTEMRHILRNSAKMNEKI